MPETGTYVLVSDVVEWLLGDLALQTLTGPPGTPIPSSAAGLELLSEDFIGQVEATEIPSLRLEVTP